MQPSLTKPRPNMLIIGPGAIGAIVCAQFQQHFQCYAFAHRDNLKLAECLISPSGDTPLAWQIYKPSSTLTFDIIWVCCKAFHSLKITQQLLKQHPQAIAILLHNGMGPQQALTDEFGARVIWGSTTCGAVKINDQQYCQTALGKTQIGNPKSAPLATAVTQLIDYCNQATRYLGLTSHDNIEQVLWHKLLANSVINPITAYAQCDNGTVLDEQFANDVAGICQEVTEIMQRNHIEPPSNAVEFVRSLASLTKDNRSSMAEDVRLARPTEIDFILGFLLEQAKLAGLTTPFLSRWYQRIIQRNQADT